MGKLFNNPKVHIQANQTHIQIMIERGNPLFAKNTSRSRNQKSIHVFLSTARIPICLLNFGKKDEDTDKDVDADRDRTRRPVVSGQPTGSSTPFEEVDIDSKVSGLPHAVVKQAEHSRVRELVKKIENHPHRQNLQADLQQNNAYNPFSEKSKRMIKDMGNVELLSCARPFPKVQCKECFLYWNQGIFYCTCGHLLD